MQNIKNALLKKTKGIRSKKSQKGFSLLTVIFVMLAMSSIGMALASMMSIQVNATALSLDGTKALYVADGVLQNVIDQYFMSDGDFSDNVSPTAGGGTIALGGGTATVAYSNQTATSARVTVTSQVGNSTRIVQQDLSQVVPLGYALACGSGNVILNGDGVVNGNISYCNGNFIQAGSFPFGAGYSATETCFTIPPINMTTYINMTTSNSSGNMTISGNYTNNIYVNGNVTIANNANVNGVIVVNGNVDVGTNVQFNGTLAVDGNLLANDLGNANFHGTNSPVRPVLVVDGNIIMTVKHSDTAQIHGLILGHGNMNLSSNNTSNLNITGMILDSEGNFLPSGQGNTTINYDPALAAAMAADNLKIFLWKEA